MEKSFEHPAYDEEPEIKTLEELEEAKKMAGVTSHKDAMERAMEKGLVSPEDIKLSITKEFRKLLDEDEFKKASEMCDKNSISNELVCEMITGFIREKNYDEILEFLGAKEITYIHNQKTLLKSERRRSVDFIDTIKNSFPAIFNNEEFKRSLINVIEDAIKDEVVHRNPVYSFSANGGAHKNLAEKPNEYERLDMNKTMSGMKEKIKVMSEQISKLIGKEIPELETLDKATQGLHSYVKDYFKNEKYIKIDKEDYENCMANINKIRQESSLSPLLESQAQ